jgi:cobalt-zinc-cadmium efflux system protein
MAHSHDHHRRPPQAGHAHIHAHHGEHEAAPGLIFALSLGLNLGFVVIEVGFGIVSGSMALLADAGHNFSDVLGLAAATAAMVLARRGPTHRYTYGLRASSILAALLNAIILLIAVGGIALEAIQRLVSPAPVAGKIVIAVALIGVVINGVSAALLARAHQGDLNVRSAFAHMVADALVSLGVAAAGAVILLTGWLWFDPVASLVIAVIIVAGTWRLLRHALDMALAAVPPGIDAQAVREHLAHLDGVAEVHDLHIWPMSTTATALTCHLVMPQGHPGDDVLAQLAAGLQTQFGIEHVTVQVETGDPDHPCQLVPDHVI